MQERFGGFLCQLRRSRKHFFAQRPHFVLARSFQTYFLIPQLLQFPLPSALGFAPALCYTPSEFEQMFERLNRTLDDVLKQPDVRRALA